MITHVEIKRADGTVEDLGDRTIIREWEYQKLTIKFDPPLPPIGNGDTLIVNSEPAWQF